MASSFRAFECRRLVFPVAWYVSASLVFVYPAYAADHEIRTRGNQWSPIVLFIEPGDSVIWVGMSGHETELIDGMAPGGAMPWQSELHEEGFRVTFTVPGAYVYKCHVHLPAGMVGAIVVGEGAPENLAEIDSALETVETGRSAVRRIIGRMKREIEAR